MKEINNFAKLYLVTAVFLLLLGQVFIRKNLSGDFSNSIRIRGIHNERENIDFLFLGSSHSYTSINSLLVEEKLNVGAYNYASARQPIDVSYFYLLDVLRDNQPKKVFLETYMINNSPVYDEVRYRDAIEPMLFSSTKVKMINELIPKNDQIYYFLPMLKYHDRWNVIQLTDFDFSYKLQKHDQKGHVALDGKPVNKFVYSNVKEDNNFSLHTNDLTYIDKIIELSEVYGFELYFFTAPYLQNEKELTKNKSLEDFTKSRNIQHLNLNNYLEDYNFEKDFFDEGHLSKSGAIKATNRILDLISVKHE